MAGQYVVRHDVMMGGVGGRGVLMAGLLLARAAMGQYENVVWFPSYASAMRGGPCECTVILSSDRIASPLVTQPGAVVIIDASQLNMFEDRVQPGGFIITESAGAPERISREDVKFIRISGVENAVAIGSAQAANLVLLGAYIEFTRAVAPELIEGEMKQSGGGVAKALALNREAFRCGLNLAADMKSNLSLG